MKNRLSVPLLLLCAACNSAPPGDDARIGGAYYPIGRSGPVDSSEVLHIAYVDDLAYTVRVAGNSGVGRYQDGALTGEISGPKLGKAVFSFTEGRSGLYEFRAFGSKVELRRLGGTR